MKRVVLEQRPGRGQHYTRMIGRVNGFCSTLHEDQRKKRVRASRSSLMRITLSVQASQVALVPRRAQSQRDEIHKRSHFFHGDCMRRTWFVYDQGKMVRGPSNISTQIIRTYQNDHQGKLRSDCHNESLEERDRNTQIALRKIAEYVTISRNSTSYRNAHQRSSPRECKNVPSKWRQQYLITPPRVSKLNSTI